MAFIRLLYIDGISRENTPFFGASDIQRGFMNNHIVASLEDGFYVPHYQDVLTLSANDVNFSTKVNYVWISFNNKSYYYFIEDISYLSETDIEIAITMDTIQTFMFDMIIHDSIIERKFINRWYKDENNDIRLNRNYIRENYSTGTWEEPSYEYVTLSDLKVICTRYSTTKGDFSSDKVYTPVWKIGEDFFFDTGYEHFTFFADNGTFIKNITVDGTDYIVSRTPLQEIRHNVTDENVLSMFIIPFNPFKDITLDGTKLSVPGKLKREYTFSDNASSTLQMGGVQNDDKDWTDNELPVIEWKHYTATVLFDTNSSTGKPYNSELITQMVDNNYIMYNFGERSYTATFPTFYTDRQFLFCKYTADVRTGTRFYGITDDKNDTVFSKGGIVATENPISITRYRDSWTAWQSRNQLTIPMAIANFAIQSMVQGLGKTSVQHVIGSEALHNVKDDVKTRSYVTPKGYRRPYTLRDDHFKQDYLRTKNYTSTREYSGSVANPSNLIDTAVGAGNAYLTPDSIKESGTYTIDNIASIKHVKYSIKVIDFEQVAWYYHQHGFLVNQPYKPTTTYWLGELMSRYYFDYYKFQYIDLDLKYMCSADMISDLTNRLISGIRVWYIDHGDMCDYQYDNVERSSL